MSGYNIPDSVKISEKLLNEIPGLTISKSFRVLFCAISIGHLRDQYFVGDCAKMAADIDIDRPITFDQFLKILHKSNLCKFGTSGSFGKLDVNWWRKVWDKIYYAGDIKFEIMDCE